MAQPRPAQPSIPHGAHQPCQQSPLILVAELHNSRRLKLLTDPLALLYIIDEHKLQANVLAVGMLASENTNRETLGPSRPQRNEYIFFNYILCYSPESYLASCFTTSSPKVIL